VARADSDRVNREGIIATQLTIAGPLKEPEVKAKPLSALTPGITRDLLRLKSGADDQQEPPKD